jgi:hypothetical protein
MPPVRLPDVPLPLQLRQLDHDRLRRYRDYLSFYEGSQWEGRARRGERRLTFNYARAVVDKVTSYLLGGHSVQVEALDGADDEARARARRAELALREVELANATAQLDFETELDCAILGDAAYKVTWDTEGPSGPGTIRISAPDVQGIYAWREPGDQSRIVAVASQFDTDEEGSTPLGSARIPASTVTEYWTATTFETWEGPNLVERGPNPYGFIPFVVFPNIREPKQPWGASDIPPLVASNRELNRAFSQLSQILELSGNPIAVIEGVTGSRDIAVEPGAIWEVPEKARA